MARYPEVRYVQFYTDGSAARELEPIKVHEPAPVRRTVKRKCTKVYVDPLAIGGIAIAGVMAVLMLVGVMRLREAQQQVAEMSAYVDTLQQENQRLHETYEAGYDLENIAWIAQALGMIPEEEAKHIILPSP